MEDDTALASRVAALESENSELNRQVHELSALLVAKQLGQYGRCTADECDNMWVRSTVPLCKAHLYSAAWEYSQLKALPRVHGDPNAEEFASRLHPPEPHASPAVYYIRMDRRVKIGTTTNLKLRMATFHAQPDQLLAIEPGDQKHERKRHKQFAHLRFERTELFEVAPDLTDHIASVRSMFGNPQQFI